MPDDTAPASNGPHEPTLEDVAAEYPGWHCYSPGIGGFVFAKLLGSFPPVTVRGEDPMDLRDQIRRWIGTH
jgi:hypothetical protein